ncbi:MAG: aspartate carbamoyltransferase [Candidatus Acetothermia bacterium]
MANEFQFDNLTTLRDKSRNDLEEIFDRASQMEAHVESGTDLARGKIMGTLFFEPSTRTRLSFQAAMSRLGGDTIGFSSQEGTSVQKGETLADTVRTVSKYVDVIVMRHPSEGSAELASEFASVPILNGGDGSANHPTQTLLDLYTIRKELGNIDGTSIALAGDLRYSRTTRSLARALTRYNVELILVSPPQLKMKDDLLYELKESGVQPTITEDLEETAASADVLYATRIQKERFPDPAEYEKVSGSYEINRGLFEGDNDPLLMHPLPRVSEITPDVDDLQNAIYFDQAGNGVPVRMALIALLLELS